MAIQQGGFNISTFKTQTADKTYFQKNSKFLVVTAIPPSLLAKSTDNINYLNQGRYMEYWCDSATIPGVALGTYEGMRYTYGARERRPFAPLFQDSMISVLADAEGENFDFWTKWILSINNFDGTATLPNEAYELSYKYEYVTDMHIYAFREDGQVSMAVMLRDAFPLMVADTRMNWSDHNIMRFSVVITYTDWNYLSYKGSVNKVLENLPS